MKKVFLFTAMLLSLALAVSSCKKDEVAAPPTLYTRLGGVNAISAVVDQFINNVAANPDMARTFGPLLADVAANGSNSARLRLLRQNLIDQIGEAAGGPLKYKGKSMIEAHRGMNITTAEFNSLVGNLVSALDQFNVPATEKNELLGVLGGLQSQIVGQ